MLVLALQELNMGSEGCKDTWSIQTCMLMNFNRNRSLLFCLSLCISQLLLSFPTSISGQPIFLSASEAIASGKWIWWILSGNQHPSDCQILGEETEMLRSWFRARYTCPWGPRDGRRRLAKCGTSETPRPEFISMLAKCDFGFQGKEFICIKMSQLLKLLCVLH